MEPRRALAASEGLGLRARVGVRVRVRVRFRASVRIRGRDRIRVRVRVRVRVRRGALAASERQMAARGRWQRGVQNGALARARVIFLVISSSPMVRCIALLRVWCWK